MKKLRHIIACILFPVVSFPLQSADCPTHLTVDLIEHADRVWKDGYITGLTLKEIVSNLKSQDPDLICFFASVNDDKLVFVCGAGKNAVAKGIHSGNLVKMASQICHGNGGGKPDLAQAGGKDVSKLDEAIEAIKNSLN